MSSPAAAPKADLPGSLRARLRLLAVVLLALLATLHLVLGLRLYFAPPAGVNVLAGSALGLALGLAALGYGLTARWVARRLRWGHLLACGLVAAAVLLSLGSQTNWLDWLVLGANVAVFALLVATVPHRLAGSAADR